MPVFYGLLESDSVAPETVFQVLEFALERISFVPLALNNLVLLWVHCCLLFQFVMLLEKENDQKVKQGSNFSTLSITT